MKKGIKLVKEDINLNYFIKEIADEMQTIAKDTKMGIKFIPSKNNPSITADPIQLQRVIKI